MQACEHNAFLFCIFCLLTPSQLLKTVNVNLVNFVKAREAQEMPRLFPSYAALYLYTAKKRSRRMDRRTAKELGLQVFLKTFY